MAASIEHTLTGSGSDMTKSGCVLAVALLALPAVLPSTAAHADRGGAVAAGIAGGLLGGLALGGAFAPRPHVYYHEPAPVYVEPPPGYYGPPPGYYRRSHCYWTRGEPYWDGYRGVWRQPRVKVCD